MNPETLNPFLKSTCASWLWWRLLLPAADVSAAMAYSCHASLLCCCGGGSCCLLLTCLLPWPTAFICPCSAVVAND